MLELKKLFENYCGLGLKVSKATQLLLLFILSLFFTLQCNADNWVCPDPKDDFCDAYHAEYLADQAEKKLNSVYKKLLSDYPKKATKEEIEFTKVAQRAWLKYSEAHCAAILNKFIGGAPFTKAQMEHSCRLEQINKRINELESYCESCNQSSPN
jgi:uncharacterized protein YecT (DUF1311 family)